MYGYGAIKSLEMLNWTPSDETSRAYALIALQDWPAVRKLRSAAVRPLIDINKDPNPVTRTKIVSLLGKPAARMQRKPAKGRFWTGIPESGGKRYLHANGVELILIAYL